MVLAGVAGLLMKRWLSDSLKSRFSDSMSELAYSYLGNLAVSFAVYFLASMGVASIPEMGYKALALERGEVAGRGPDFAHGRRKRLPHHGDAMQILVGRAFRL